MLLRMLLRVPIAACGTVLTAIMLAGCSSSAPGGAEQASAGSGDDAPATAELSGAKIPRVVDGDTLHVRLASGKDQKVRLIGIDTPETSTLRNGHTECGGEQAAGLARTLSSRWPRVNLSPDPGQDAYDQYGRLLAYVEPVAAQGTTFQQELLRGGWARVYVYDRDPF